MTNFKIYTGIEELHRLNTSISIALDTETLQLQPEKGKLRLIQLGCLVTRTIVLIDCFTLDENDWMTLDRFFNNGYRFWIAHNAVFDLAWLQEYGIHPRAKQFGCTMLASRLLTNGRIGAKHGLAALAKRYLNVELPKDLQVSNWGADELSKEQLLYAARDVEILVELDEPMNKRLMSADLIKAYKKECKALPAMAQMWRTGLPWNREALQQRKVDYEYDVKHLGDEFLVELDRALIEIGEAGLPREGVDTEYMERIRDLSTQTGHADEDYSKWERELETIWSKPFNLRNKDEGSIRLGTKKYAGFNLNSPIQLRSKFKAILGFEPLDANGKPSASRQALRTYAADHSVIQTYLEWKKAEKRRQMITSIQDKMNPDGFVRASYMQLGADTGRMSSIKPNNQQIPRDIEFRQCVEAPEGWSLISADYSQMELRLAAAVSKDTRMIEAFQGGEDLHEVTAEALGCSRSIAKSANFGLLYGSGAQGLRNYAGASGITISLDEATKVRNDWLKAYPGIARWQSDNALLASTTQGDKWPEIRIPGSHMRRFVLGDLNRLTVRCNTPIQGAGAAILKTALGYLWPNVKAAGEDVVRIAAAVHDEILLLVKEEYAHAWAELLQETMEDAERKWLGPVPALAEVSVGKNWGEIH